MVTIVKQESKYKIVRSIYQLTLDSLVELIKYRTVHEGAVGKTALAYWESKKRIPTLDNLKVYVSIFGISLDWLAGISNTPYTQDSVQYGERKLFEILDRDNTLNIPYFDAHDEFKTFKYDYMYPEDRSKFFSLEVRANILTLLWILHALPSAKRVRFNENVEGAVLQEKPVHRNSKAALEKQRTYHDNLLKLLSTHRNIPLYVIPNSENSNE